MTTTAGVPTGRPGTAPRGPAGPAPEPHGPKTPVRPAEPPKPTTPSKSGDLLVLDNLLTLALLAADDLPAATDRVETCGQEILRFRLRRASAAVGDLLQYAGRDGKDTVPAVASRPVQPPARTGECLAPGSGAATGNAATESDRAVAAPVAGAQLPAGPPPRPGGDFLLPRPPEFEIGVGPVHGALPRAR
jgi:hypothetical protein